MWGRIEPMANYTKKGAKEEIPRLITKFEGLSKNQFKKYNEANTRKDFILPLFHALGWDVYNDFCVNEVTEEETGVSGRIDYSFRIDNITQFLLEAKAIPENLDKEKWAHQAIEYGWNKGIPWVVLTDFEGLKIFNSEWKVNRPRPNIDLSYKDYIGKFDKLWLLSKPAFENNELDKLLSEFGVTAKRVSVNEKLAEELVSWRGILTNNLKQWNEKLPLEDIEEAVQRILDRLIFIRVLEDRGIEDKDLWQTYQKWLNDGKKPLNFIEKLIPLFRDFDKKYNSNLFQEHVCEKLETEGAPFTKIIPELYGDKEGGIKYRFDAIDVDVLGNVYEQYLGHVQKREGETSKRKKQGIYYTPSYIVDYIVQNTVGEILNGKRTLVEKEGIKILDPACGSGSFLIKAFEVVDNHIKSLRNKNSKNLKQDALRRYRVLTENIYGVDLDEQAIEIARLNLLLKALVPGNKLPLLTEHMKVGNSLISDEKITDKAFNWEKEFPDVFKVDNLGFDVIVGNPPWGAKLTEKDKAYFRQQYKTAKGLLDTFALFLERAATLLKHGGYLGFILPDIVLLKNYPAIRKYILNNFVIVSAVHSGMIFKGVNLDSVVLIFKKEANEKTRRSNSIHVVSNIISFEKKEWQETKIPQKLFKKTSGYKFNLYLTPEKLRLKKKIDEKSLPLRKIGEAHEGIHSGNIRGKLFVDKKESAKHKKLILKGGEVGKYCVNWQGKYVNYDSLMVNRNKGEYANLSRRDYFEKPKILVRRTGDKVIACLDKKGFYASNNLFVFQSTKNRNYNLNTVLLFFNSRLVNWYFLTIQPRKGRLFAELKIVHIDQFPVFKFDFSVKKDVETAKRLDELSLKRQELAGVFKAVAINTGRWRKLKKEIEQIDKKIDQMVYHLYKLTPKEIEIIEKSI